MYDVIFRCDGSNYKNIGMGHVYRSLSIADFFTKNYKVQKKKVLFITKKYKENNIVKKIIKQKKYEIKSFSNNEIKYLGKFKSKSLIIDRVKKEKQSDIDKLKKNFYKIICLDSENYKLKNCLKINSLIHNENIKYSGYKYLISPLVNNFKKEIPEKKRKIFICLGGVSRKKKIFTILKNLKKIKNVKISLPEFLKDIKNKDYNFYNNRTFYKNLFNSKIVICSGGLILFDSLYLGKRTICVPNDEYQQKNIKNIKKDFKYKFTTCKNLKNIENIIVKNLTQKKANRSFKNKQMKDTIKLIYDYIYV